MYCGVVSVRLHLHLYRTHNQCGDTIEKSQAPDDGLLMSETC